MSRDYDPPIVAARLRKRISKKGAEYLAGYMGLVRVVVLKTNETADDGSEIFNLIFSQAKERRQDTKPSPAERAKVNEPPTEARSSRPMPNDPIPF